MESPFRTMVATQSVFHRRRCRGEEASSSLHVAIMGSSTFKLLCSLCAPDKPEDTSYANLKEKLDKQYSVKRLVLAERHRFYTYKQGKTQSLSEYVSELRRLALTCDWNQAQLADNLRNKFVMGLSRKIWTPIFIPPGPKISEYFGPPELNSLKYLDPL